jgi:ribose/xylose/arabinose/galactoside ABC-type transport system permease subunit
VVALTAYLTGRLFLDVPGIPLLAVVLAGLAAGAVLGLVNGLLVTHREGAGARHHPRHAVHLPRARC